MGFLVGRERFTTSGAARIANSLEGIETGLTAVRMDACGQFTTQGANGREYGIENSSGKTFPVHGEEYAKSLPVEEFSMRKTGRLSDGAKGKDRPYDPTTLGLGEKS